MLYKRYIDVIAKIGKDGTLIPIYICWDNDIKYKIDRILSVERRASQVGGCGIRYVCMIQGQQRNIFLERDRFFIESFQP